MKPGNLLIERGGDEGDPDHVYLADFGITKHAMSRSGLTSTGQFLGTIDYVAPEQIRGTSVTGLADQYSLGCVLYECLTGRVPFEKDLDAAIIWAHVEETPTMPTVLRPELPPEVDEVFARVLAKRPDERYQSCREFVEAARMALGIFGPGTESSLAFGAMTAGPRTGAPPGSQARVSADRFSWSSQPGPSHGRDPVNPMDPVAAGSVAYAAPSGPERPGGTLTSHRREPGLAGPGEPGQPAGAQPPTGRPQEPREPRWYQRPRWLALAAALVLIAAGLGTLAGLNGSGSHGDKAMSSMSARPKPKKPTQSELMKALVVTNQSADAKGQLPPSTCKQDNSTEVTCTAPVVGISGVVFQTYPNLTALYAAYMAKVASLNSGQFKQNFNDCESQDTYGEVAWNHLFQHPKNYTVDQMTMSGFTDDKAAGRVFCNYTQGLEYMVWTQNDGRVMGVVAGPVHGDVWNWWVAVHHNIGLGGASMNMNMNPSPSMSGTSPSPSMSGTSPSPSMSGTSPSPSMSSPGG